MADETEISEAQKFFGGMTSDGVGIIVQLMHIKAGETVVYHVGDLRRDVLDPTMAYRTGDAPPKEIVNIVWLAEATARKGKCRLDTVRVTDEISVHLAVGL